MLSLRGLLCVLLLPFHTTLLGSAAIVASLAAPRGDAVLTFGRLWSRLNLMLAGVRLRSLHAERSAAGPFIVLCNHQSLFDIPALVLTLRGSFRIVAKRELFHVPVFGWALRASGFIGVDRSRRDRAIESLSQGLDELRRGRSLVLFAEGTRSRDGRLGPLKKGAFHLAQQAQVPLLPVTFSGSRAVLAKQGWIPRPGRVDAHVGQPLPPAPPGAPIDDAVLAAARAALQAGYTERHRDDLAVGPGRRAREAASGREPAR